MKSGPRNISIPLSEKIGAMNVIDELRGRRAKVEEHLDLPRRRAEIAHEIRSYYQRQGIPFDDDLIEQGVREFFTRRLVYEVPELGRFRQLLTHALVSREKKPQAPKVQQGRADEETGQDPVASLRDRVCRSVGRLVRALYNWMCLLLLASPLLLFGWVTIYIPIKEKLAYNAYFKYLDTGSTPQLSQIRRGIEKIEEQLEKTPDPVIAKKLSGQKLRLEEVYQLLPPPFDDSTGAEEKQRRQDLLDTNSSSFLSRTERLINSLDDTEEFFALKEEIDEVLSSDDYRRARLRNPSVKNNAEDLMDMYIRSADSLNNYEEVKRKLRYLNSSIRSALSP